MDKLASVPLQFFGGAATVVGSTILNPAETAGQAPIAAALVGGIQAPKAIEKGQAAARVYKEVAPEHGAWEGAKAAIRISPEIVRAIAQEVTVEESAVGKLHHKVSEVVARSGVPAEVIQAFFDLYYGVEKTAPGAEAIYRRPQREVSSRTQRFEDNYGKDWRKISKEDRAVLYDVLSAGQSSTHYAAFLLGQFGKMQSEGGAVGASKMLRSRKGKTQAETDAIAAELDATAMAIEAQEGIIKSEALENADVLREVVAEREAMVPDVALPDVEPAVPEAPLADWMATDIAAIKAARLEELSGMQPFRKGGRTKLEEEEWIGLLMDSFVESPESAPIAPTLEPRTPEVPTARRATRDTSSRSQDG